MNDKFQELYANILKELWKELQSAENLYLEISQAILKSIAQSSKKDNILQLEEKYRQKIAGIISNLIMLPITMLVSFKSFQHGWDPDNITSPIIAAFGDLFTLPAIILSILILS